MKKALLKDSIKEIKNTYKRFISILLMAFLGVGFFAGIRATSPDMIDTIDQYYDTQNVYDIEIISTLGLTQEDVQALEQIEGVEAVYGTISQDTILEVEDTEVVAKVIAIEEVNKPVLKEGRMPENKQECLVERKLCTRTGKQIGDWIEIEVSQNNTEDSTKNIIQETKMQIVGIVESPLYISRERGNSKFGSGKVDYFIYTPKENMGIEVYTSAYITLADIKAYTTGSTAYVEKVEKAKNKIEQIKETRQNARYESLVGEATQKLEEAKQELETQKQEAMQKLEEAQVEIDKGKQELEDAEKALQSSKKMTEEKFAQAEKQIQNAKVTIEANEKTLQNKKKEANEQINQAKQLLETQQANLRKVEEAIEQIDKQYTQIIEKISDQTITEEEKNILEQTKNNLIIQKENLQVQEQQIENAVSQIQTQINTANQEIQTGEKQIEQAKIELSKQEQQLKTSKIETQKQIEQASKQIADGRIKIQEGERTLEENRKQYDEKVKDAEEKLVEAQNKIEKIEHPKWYILDRESNTGYHSFIQDTKSVENLGKIFPIVFFVIATLISLTSMTRMVEEQRGEIGTLKALGYYKRQIAIKYILYATLACVIGGILGMCVGFVLLPKIIWMMYSMMYTISDIALSFNWYFAIWGLGIASVCIIGATGYAVYKDLKSTPAQLMRPKAPKIGKRVFLERIPLLWKKLSFSKKVTIRNIFRYKKRFLMTIIGIAGCTALILTGFGIKDAISAILPNQYEKVYHYNMQVSLQSGLEESEKQRLVEDLLQKEQISNILEAEMIAGTLQKGEKQEDVQIIISGENTLKDMIALKDIKTKESIALQENKIAITDKVAELLNVKKGDTIVLKDNNQVEKEIEISNVVENYISHYVYMSKELYEELYERYETNILFVKSENLADEEETNLSKEILEKEEVGSVVLTSNVKGLMDDMMSSLNYVVIILIISAGLLAFVVLYNLANINISERIRELATIKVLGFYDKEVYTYVTRETVILTAIGILLGLVGGYCLNYFIMGTCEINILRFTKDIQPLSYLYAIVITLIFTAIVNIVTYFSLKKIDMIESLKSVE